MTTTKYVISFYLMNTAKNVLSRWHTFNLQQDWPLLESFFFLSFAFFLISIVNKLTQFHSCGHCFDVKRCLRAMWATIKCLLIRKLWLLSQNKTDKRIGNGMSNDFNDSIGTKTFFFYLKSLFLGLESTLTLWQFISVLWIVLRIILWIVLFDPRWILKTQNFKNVSNNFCGYKYFGVAKLCSRTFWKCN